MSNVLHVKWTVTSLVAPQPWLTCGQCSDIKPFQSSGKARLNANGKRLDAWLIYKCVDCDNSWNRPLFERKGVRDIDPRLLRALQTNDPEWTEALAFDAEALRRKAGRIEEFAEVRVDKHVLASNSAPLSRIEIVLNVPLRSCLRVDRLLAVELGVSRSKVQGMQSSGVLKLLPDGERMLRRPVRDGIVVAIEVSSADDDVKLVSAATGRAPPGESQRQAT